MPIENLSHEELLEFNPSAGSLYFAGQRALLLDAAALGDLRKRLVEGFGMTAARAVLTDFGFAQGWRMAEAAKCFRDWTTDEAWQDAGLELNRQLPSVRPIHKVYVQDPMRG
jgi:hypothetical protein